LKRQSLSLLFALGRPLSGAYSLLMMLRSAAYRRGFLKSRELPCRVISVGNLSMGGTGKTPHVMTLAEWFRDRGLEPAVITRGYGGRAGKGPLVVSDGTEVLVSPEVGGDEPVMMAGALPGVPVIAGSDRFSGGRLAVRRFGSRVIILDDGFQHFALRRDIDLVLLPASNPLGTGRVFPGGNLRESPTALKRATAILITKAEEMDDADREIIRGEIHAICPGRPVFFSRLEPSGPNRMANSMEQETEQMPGGMLYAFCAIADPDSFFFCLERLEVKIAGRKALRDHHPYTPADLSALAGYAADQGAAGLVTTAKDWVKIKPLWKDILEKSRKYSAFSLWVLDIHARPEEGFWKMLESYQE